jgi:hypothetical protein
MHRVAYDDGDKMEYVMAKKTYQVLLVLLLEYPLTYQPARLPACLPACPPARPPACPPARPSVRPPVRPPARPPAAAARALRRHPSLQEQARAGAVRGRLPLRLAAGAVVPGG